MRIFLNDTSREVARGTSIAALLEQLDLESRQVAVEVNLHILERMEFESRPLQEGDCVEILSFVGGGAEAFLH